jgi:hypothetical protein
MGAGASSITEVTGAYWHAFTTTSPLRVMQNDSPAFSLVSPLSSSCVIHTEPLMTRSVLPCTLLRQIMPPRGTVMSGVCGRSVGPGLASVVMGILAKIERPHEIRRLVRAKRHRIG